MASSKNSLTANFTDEHGLRPSALFPEKTPHPCPSPLLKRKKLLRLVLWPVLGSSQIANRKSQIANRKSQIANRKSQIANRKSQIANRKSQIANRKSQIANRK